jgi:hypothetical protein
MSRGDAGMRYYAARDPHTWILGAAAVVGTQQASTRLCMAECGGGKAESETEAEHIKKDTCTQQRIHWLARERPPPVHDCR